MATLKRILIGFVLVSVICTMGAGCMKQAQPPVRVSTTPEPTPSWLEPAHPAAVTLARDPFKPLVKEKEEEVPGAPGPGEPGTPPLLPPFPPDFVAPGEPPTLPGLRLTGIFVTDRPQALIQEGRIGHIVQAESVVGENWKVETITSDTVVLVREEQKVNLTLGDRK